MATKVPKFARVKENMGVKSNRISDVRDYLIHRLKGIYEAPEAGSIASLLLEDVTGKCATDLRVNIKDDRLSESQLVSLYKAKDRLLAGEPIQYVLGWTQFLDLRIQCDARALIPRPETEELAYWIMQDGVEESDAILDIGTGTGCIAIQLQKALKVPVAAWDFSADALTLAKINGQHHEAQVYWQLQDALNWENIQDLSATVVVSNPPYVLESDKAMMHQNVLEHEPDTALFVPDNDPLKFYRAILEMIQEKGATVSRVYFEIHELLGEELIELAESNGWQAVLRKDLSGKDRLMKLVR